MHYTKSCGPQIGHAISSPTAVDVIKGPVSAESGGGVPSPLEAHL